MKRRQLLPYLLELAMASAAIYAGLIALVHLAAWLKGPA